MSLNEWQIFNIRLFGGNKKQVLKLVTDWSGNRPLWIATVNPEFVVKASKDRQFNKILQKTSLNVVDGVTLFWAREVEKEVGFWSRLVKGWQVGTDVLRGRFDRQMVRGSELMVDLARVSKRVFLLGGYGNGAKMTGEYIKSKCQMSNDQCQTFEGEPKYGNDEVIKKITTFRPDLLLVAYGMVKQEKWIEANLLDLKKIGVKIVMGVGRSFDYYGGRMKQPPVKWRKMGLEWLYSLVQEPKRIVRQWQIVKFVIKIVLS